jgi:hypothetical protein
MLLNMADTRGMLSLLYSNVGLFIELIYITYLLGLSHIPEPDMLIQTDGDDTIGLTMPIETPDSVLMLTGHSDILGLDV